MRVVILGNGEWEKPRYFLQRLRKRDFLIACDGAYLKAKQHGLKPQLLIGDLDSVRQEPKDPRLRILRFPRDKNETDGELAFQFAIEKKPDEILWYGAFGGRLDHSFVNLFLLAQAARRKVPVTLVQGYWEVRLILQSTSLRGKEGDRVSLLPLSQKVEGITTKGLRYPLTDEPLFSSHTRGMSNEMTSQVARIEIEKGWLLAFHENS